MKHAFQGRQKNLSPHSSFLRPHRTTPRHLESCWQLRLASVDKKKFKGDISNPLNVHYAWIQKDGLFIEIFKTRCFGNFRIVRALEAVLDDFQEKVSCIFHIISKRKDCYATVGLQQVKPREKFNLLRITFPQIL